MRNRLCLVKAAVKDHMTGRGVAFIATKPLQVIVSMVLRDQLGLRGTAALHVVDNFDGARDVANRLRDTDDWLSVDLHADRQVALREASKRSKRIFLDRDVGMRMFLEMLAVRMRTGSRFSVYEEGISSYDKVSELSPKHQALLRVVGGASIHGRSRFTSELWLFRPEEAPLPSRLVPRLRRIEERLSAYVSKHRAELVQLFWPSEHLPAGGPRCNVYLPGWEPNLGIARSIVGLGDDSLLKLHPHTRAKDPVQDLSFTYSVPASVPAELILPELSARYEQVEVHHHDSSVVLYAELDNVVFHSHGAT